MIMIFIKFVELGNGKSENELPVVFVYKYVLFIFCNQWCHAFEVGINCSEFYHDHHPQCDVEMVAESIVFCWA